jgi:hypothetical protein
LGTNRVRADTTVVPANVCYPTDSGLLAEAIRRIAATRQRIHHAGGAVRTRLRDRSQAAGKRHTGSRRNCGLASMDAMTDIRATREANKEALLDRTVTAISGE